MEDDATSPDDATDLRVTYPGWDDINQSAMTTSLAETVIGLVDAASDLNQRLTNWFTLQTNLSSSVNTRHTLDIFYDSGDESPETDTCASAVWLLGCRYPHIGTKWPSDVLDDFRSRVQCTYRNGFEPIHLEHPFTSDIGWGCMIRSGQSLLAQALVMSRLKRTWRVQRQEVDVGQWDRYVEILKWFHDSVDAPFSLHKMATVGWQECGITIGEWFGPSTISHVLHKVVDQFPECGLTIVPASDGTVYRDSVLDAAMRDRVFHPVLVLVPTMLGVKQLNPVYTKALKACFTLPCSVGIAGGRPAASLYFCGFQDDYLYYLDPHVCQAAVPRTEDVYTEHEAASYHCASPRKISIDRIDPCMLLGFFFSTQQEFDAFYASIQQACVFSLD